MPDPILILKAMGLAAVIAAVVLFLAGRFGRPEVTTWSALGWTLGLGIGFAVGCRLLGLWPRWPPREDQDRFLILVLPTALAVELLVSFPRVPDRLTWLLRLAVALGTAPVLLHGTIYLSDAGGPGTREWSPAGAGLILVALASALATAWAALLLLARRSPGPSIPTALAGTLAGASATIMLSGYATGGQLGLPLAAALAGASAVTFWLKGPARSEIPIGVGIVGLFGLLTMGRFFGELGTAQALVLFGAPMLCWLPEFPDASRPRPVLRGVLRVVLVGVVVAAVVVLAARKFAADSGTKSGTPGSSADDYMNYGK